MTKNIIDHSFKEMNNSEEILNKAWSQELLKKWKDGLMEKLKEIVMTLSRTKKELEDKERFRK